MSEEKETALTEAEAPAAAPEQTTETTEQRPEELAGESDAVSAETVEAESATRKKIRRSEKGVKEYQFFILRAALLLLVLWALFFKIVGLTVMPTGDMFPRVDMGDLVLFYRLDKNVRAQDVIVIDKTTPDTRENKLYILRVIAVAGDTVEITEQGGVCVNGNTLVESNIFYATPRYEDYTEYPITLGPGECFVLADHRGGGADSRYFGPVQQSEIDGTVITIVRRNNF